MLISESNIRASSLRHAESSGDDDESTDLSVEARGANLHWINTDPSQEVIESKYLIYSIFYKISNNVNIFKFLNKG